MKRKCQECGKDFKQHYEFLFEKSCTSIDLFPDLYCKECFDRLKREEIQQQAKEQLLLKENYLKQQ